MPSATCSATARAARSTPRTATTRPSGRATSTCWTVSAFYVSGLKSRACPRTLRPAANWSVAGPRQWWYPTTTEEVCSMERYKKFFVVGAVVTLVLVGLLCVALCIFSVHFDQAMRTIQRQFLALAETQNARGAFQ